MPLKRSAIVSRRKVLKIDIDGEVLNIAYDQAVITPRFEQLINDPNFGQGDQKPQVVQLTAMLLKEWDLQEEDGSPTPLTEEVLMDLPSAILLLIFKAISEDIRPNESTSGGSGSFS